MKRKSFIAILTAMALLSGCASQENSASVSGMSSAGDTGSSTASADGGYTPSGAPAAPAVSASGGSSAAGVPESVVSDAPEEYSSSFSTVTSEVAPTSSASSAETFPASTTVPHSVETPAGDRTDPTGSEYKGTDIGGTGTSAGGFDDALDGGIMDFDICTDEACEIAEDPMTGGFADTDYCPEPDPDYPYIEPQIPPAAGLLTGGEWKDNDNWEFWQDLYGSANYSVDWEEYRNTWRTDADFRLEVTVKDSSGNLVSGAKVSSDKPNYSAVTDNHGKAYLFFSKDLLVNGTSGITVSFGNASQTEDVIINGDQSLEITLNSETKPNDKTLDFMIVCDTTGSMWDELDYLKAELEDVVTRIKQENANIPTRMSVNFYRDEGDEYVVREFPFTTDLGAAVNAIAAQSADGGGDTPEAVHTALESAINNHDWDENSIKVMFLVLDAPPHDDIQIIDQTVKLVKTAAEKGIRIIPVASSGIDKSTEYLLRSMAFMTGGTYAFLTNDSGIGGDHIEPTIGSYEVEKLNDLMVRITVEYLK